MSFGHYKEWVLPVSLGIIIGMTVSSFLNRKGQEEVKARPAVVEEFSIADQPKRFAKAKEDNNRRVLDIDFLYNPSFLKDKVVLITGGNRGIGLALAQEIKKYAKKTIITSRLPKKITGVDVVSGIDVQDNHCGTLLANALNGTKIDILINNAGYFFGPVETIKSLNFNEEIKMIDICAIGPLRITSGLFNAGLLALGAKVAMISSQGGSVAWRKVQNPHGHDYGHHMSKAAENMMGMLLSREFRDHQISVSILHPGFNKTDMTKKYEKIWEIEGAVDSTVGAKRVVHEISRMTMRNTGNFVNCEDGLLIPW